MDSAPADEPSSIPCEVFKSETPDAVAKQAEEKRLRELLKYFSATCRALGLVDNEIQSQKPYNPDSAIISPDPVLNALAQLGAVRLQVDRAIISLIDAEYQYLIAESTRSLSLYDAKNHKPDDQMCIGARPLDLTSGICAGTVHIFHDDSKLGTCISTNNIFADRTRYIINDLSKEPVYKDRPYVRGFPFMRYYAEVPITSASGHVIGTYSVYHGEARQGLSDEDYLVLTELASATMRYLEKIKVQDDHAQASRLLQGLNAFVQDDPMTAKAFEDHRHKRPAASPPAGNPHKRPRASSVLSSKGSVENLSAPSYDSYFGTRSRGSSGTPIDGSITPSPLVTPIPPGIIKTEGSPDVVPPAANAKPKPLAFAAEQAKGEIETELRDSAIPDEVRETFSRASHILRKAMDLDGVIFLDAALSNFASSSDMPMAASPFASVGSGNTEDDSPNGSDEDGQRSPKSQGYGQSNNPIPRNTRQPSESQGSSNRPQYRLSGRLGYSIRELPDMGKDAVPPENFSLPEDVHQSLLRYYPKGHIFNFTHDRRPSHSNGARTRTPSVRARSGFRKKPIKRRDIEEYIRLFFPDVRSAIFMPLWNPHKESWFAGSVGWTRNEKRVLQRGDFAYFSVFGNSMMAEVTRLELIASVQAKSDFISSISHELRSPLHGILGSAELLRESDTTSNQRQLIGMVENCGRTLLDTMDHILDFAKINSNPTRRQRYNDGAIQTVESNVASGVFEDLSTFDLSQLVEEITESLIAGHRYNNSAARRMSGQDESQTYASLLQSSSTSAVTDASPVMVILNIDHQSAAHISSEATAWRRILLNLLGNALKYTSVGFIEVMLRTAGAKEAVGQRSSSNFVTLTISDTGRGIGKTYLQSHLYTPFIQENNLSSGTGLGLSIVQKMVGGLGGTLDIQSELGEGTRVKVSIPVLGIPGAGEESIPRSLGKDATICLLGFGDSLDSEEPTSENLPLASRHLNTLRVAILMHAKNWLGFRVKNAGDSQLADADIIVVAEDRLDLLQIDDGTGRKTVKVPRHSSLVILSPGYDKKHQLTSTTANRIAYLSQPFGPRNIAELFALALKANRDEAVYGVRETELAGDGTRRGSTDSAIHDGISRQDMDPQSVQQNNTSAVQDPHIAEGAKKPYILVVDDNDVNLRILVSYIKKLGYDFATGRNGQEAFDVFTKSTKPFDYVLMDVSMPVMDGFAATRAIRDFEREAQRQPTPIIALTGLGSAQAQQEAFTSGMNMFFTKPVPMKRIKALVERGVEAVQQQP